jgi:hypothetical protein
MSAGPAGSVALFEERVTPDIGPVGDRIDLYACVAFAVIVHIDERSLRHGGQRQAIGYLLVLVHFDGAEDLSLQWELEIQIAIDEPCLILQQHECVINAPDEEGRGVGDVACDEVGLICAAGRADGPGGRVWRECRFRYLGRRGG